MVSNDPAGRQRSYKDNMQYNPCRNAKLNWGTTYQQQRRYFVMMKKDTTCPRKHFLDDLLKQLNKWRQEGDRLIVCMDANKDI